MLGHHAVSEAPVGALVESGLSATIAETLALADSLAFAMGKVLTEAMTISEALAMQTGKVLTDDLSLADAVSTVLSLGLSVSDALSILDALSIKTGKPLSDTMSLADTVSTMMLSVPTLQTVYAPRPLITLTIAAATVRYSTETLETP